METKIIQAMPFANTKITGAVWTKVLLSKSDILLGDAFKIESDGGIKVVKGGLYRVTAGLYFNSMDKDTTGYGVQVQIGQKVRNITIPKAKGQSFYGSVFLAPKIVHIMGGEKLYLSGRLNGAATMSGIVTATGVNTYLLIEQVQEDKVTVLEH